MVVQPESRVEWARARRVHGMVAVQMSEFMPGDVGERENLRGDFTEREAGSDLSAAWLRSRIGELGRLITEQVATVGWHLRESGRPRQLIGVG